MHRLALFIASASNVLRLPADSAKTPADSAMVALQKAAEAIVANPNEAIKHLIQSAINFGLKLVAAIVIYAIGAWIIKRIKVVLRKFFERRHTETTLASFVSSLVTITLTVLLIVITIGTLGINTTSVAAILAAGGMAIGMALSGTVQNFAGGIMILLFKPFKVGDYIKAQGQEGYVTEVTIVSTKIRTYANSLIVLPNGSLSNGTIDNFSHNPTHRVQWMVNVPYGADAKFVKDVVMEIILADDRILKEGDPGYRKPSINLNELKDSSVEFVARAWVNVEDYWSVLYDINERIYTTWPERGISFPFPQLDVHLDK